tara:strand:+ start:19449 stop:19862 length:414 start_codon:yes stop_codon:yes gene_type:complete
MSRSSAIDLDWGDDTFRFAMKWGELAELQEKTDAGPYVILQRLHNGSWRVEDISNVIRLGLIGGGMAPEQALKKVRFYVQQRPPLESVPYAIAILSTALLGATDEPLGEPEAPSPDQSTTSQTGSSDLAPSTEQEPS